MRDLIKASAEKFDEAVLRFSCKRDADLETFLRDKACFFENKAKSRTYFLIDADVLKDSVIEIVAYFAVAPQILHLPNEMSVRQAKRLDGFSGKIHGERIKALPVILIGQLAKNDKYSNDIKGNELLEYAMSIVRKSYEAIGGRIAMVETKTQANGLLHFYESNGFERVTSDESTGLTQMIFMLSE